MATSDALTLDTGQVALITYWEVRAQSDLDVYRCVDVVDESFAQLSQRCWKALRPTGHGPTIIEDALSSNDICGSPDGFNGFSSVAYCSVSEPLILKTPFFELTIDSLGGEGILAVDDGGRSLYVTYPSLPGSGGVTVTVSPVNAHETAPGVPEATDGTTGCGTIDIAGRTWSACVSTQLPASKTMRLIEDEKVYEIWLGYEAEMPEEQVRRLNEMVRSVRLR